jgi:signal peptidase II
VIAVVGCAVDLATKEWIFDRLGMPGTRPPIWIWQDVFCLTTSLNEGALFGLGQGFTTWFAALSVVAGIVILYWMFRGGSESWWLTTALGSVAAGISGNLYDRLGFPGLVWHQHYAGHVPGEPVYAVRDWLYFKLIEWPVFNIADSMLVCGAIMIALSQLRQPAGAPSSTCQASQTMLNRAVTPAERAS